MSRSIAIVIILVVMAINFQCGEATFAFFCNQFKLTMNAVMSLFGKRRVQFYLHTRAYGNPQVISCDQECDFRRTDFNPNLRTTLLIHGFLNDHKADWVTSLIPKLLRWQNMNVIVVDWSEIFNVNYFKTARRIVDVARQTKKLLEELARKTGKDLKSWPYIHIMGHSLGAHVAGQIAENLKSSVFSVHRITAFDPAKPYFDKQGSHLKLNKRFAQFVDVIHTNSARDQDTFGLHEPIGHIDFYPNGGDRQPRCHTGGIVKRFLFTRPLDCLSKAVFGINIDGLQSNFLLRLARGDDMVCDHGEAPNYFIESIENMSKFLATKVVMDPEYASSNCGKCYGRDCVKMGMEAYRYSHPWYHGVYYVDTACRS